jgi:hypothetical protein
MATAALTLPSSATRCFYDANPMLATASVAAIDEAAQFIAGADRLHMTACRVGSFDDRGRSYLTDRWPAHRNGHRSLYPL